MSRRGIRQLGKLMLFTSAFVGALILAGCHKEEATEEETTPATTSTTTTTETTTSTDMGTGAMGSDMGTGSASMGTDNMGTGTTPPPDDGSGRVGGIQHPQPAYNEEMDRELKRAMDQLKPGRIAYNPKLAMQQGIEEKVTVRISDDPRAALAQGFARAPTVEALKISGTMSAYLDDDNRGDFDIVPLSSADQPVAGPYTDWLWQVTPLRRGTHRLHLRVTARIWLSNQHVETKDLLVKDAEISVAVRPWFVARRFVASYWQWILGSPIVLGGIAWVGKRVSARRRHPIGFS